MRRNRRLLIGSLFMVLLGVGTNAGVAHASGYCVGNTGVGPWGGAVVCTP